MEHLTMEELVAGLEAIRRSPTDEGRVELIVRRPAIDEREELDRGELSLAEGLVGDTWSARPSSRSDDGGPHPDMQLNVMNARAIAHIAGDPARRSLAGDQLYLDLDLSPANLPSGTRLALGSAVIEITDQPHRGCAKFAERFGLESMRFVNSPAGQELRLRGVNAKVVVPGAVGVGDAVRKVAPTPE